QMTNDLWEVFIEDGRQHARRFREGVQAAIAGGPVEAAATDAYTLAQLALLMGVEEVGLLAHACDRAIAYAATATVSRRGELLQLVAAGAAALEEAFAGLARADASGAREEKGPLVAARGTIERFLEGETEEPSASTPTSTPTQVVEASGVWVPSVDE